MCIFIAIAIRDSAAAKETLRGYRFFEFKNDSLSRLVPPPFCWAWVTDGHCSCDYHLDPIDTEAEIARVETKYNKPKFRERGWTQRRIADKVIGIRKRSITRPGGLNADLFAALQTIAASGDGCHFLVTTANGDDQRMAVPVNRELKVGTDGDISGPESVEQDVLYEII